MPKRAKGPWVSRLVDRLYIHLENKNKEIEQYKHTLEHYVKEIKLLTAEIDEKDEKIERVNKEKEWLIQNLMGTWQQDIQDKDDDELRKFILKEMQQALKEQSTESIRKYDNKGGPI